VRSALVVLILLTMEGAVWPRSTLAADRGPLAASADRLARAEGRQAGGAQPTPPEHRRGASRAEKLAWAYLLIGGCVFIATSPGEKGDDGRWSSDGKWEMAGGIGAVAISFGLLHDILSGR
jgi:hypothetical protein